MFVTRRIYSLCRLLPPADAHYRAGDVTFDVYCARSWHSSWCHPILQQLALVARSSYDRYGDRPFLDPYDRKAATYLVRARYPRADVGGMVEEWLSIRIVPGGGEPLGGGELELYSYRGNRLDEVFRKQLARPPEAFWQQIVSSSRMCGIRPYASDPHAPELGTRHRYTAACFAIIHAQFLLDYPLDQYPSEYVTAIIRHDLIERSLTLVRGDQRFSPAFIPAGKLLCLDHRDITVDRAAYAYEFPTYWFDAPKLMALLEELVGSGQLTVRTLQHYLGAPLESPEAREHLGKLLTVDGPLQDSPLTGAALRALIDEQVPVVPELKIADVASWNRAILAMLEAAGADLLEQHPFLVGYR